MGATITRAPWEQQANCLGMDPDLFFPERGEDPAPAKAVCAGCAVRKECLAMALAQRMTHGVWGGLTAAERKRLRWRQGLRVAS